MNAWVLAYDGFDPPGERLREAPCTLGNGYLATRLDRVLEAEGIRLPEELDGLDFDVRYRGNWGINLHLTPGSTHEFAC